MLVGRGGGRVLRVRRVRGRWVGRRGLAVGVWRPAVGWGWPAGGRVRLGRRRVAMRVGRRRLLLLLWVRGRRGGGRLLRHLLLCRRRGRVGGCCGLLLRLRCRLLQGSWGRKGRGVGGGCARGWLLGRCQVWVWWVRLVGRGVGSRVLRRRWWRDDVGGRDAVRHVRKGLDQVRLGGVDEVQRQPACGWRNSGPREVPPSTLNGGPHAASPRAEAPAQRTHALASSSCLGVGAATYTCMWSASMKPEPRPRSCTCAPVVLWMCPRYDPPAGREAQQRRRKRTCCLEPRPGTTWCHSCQPSPPPPLLLHHSGAHLARGSCRAG